MSHVCPPSSQICTAWKCHTCVHSNSKHAAQCKNSMKGRVLLCNCLEPEGKCMLATRQCCTSLTLRLGSSFCCACVHRFHTDPSGTFVTYEAKAIGSGSEGAQTSLQVPHLCQSSCISTPCRSCCLLFTRRPNAPTKPVVPLSCPHPNLWQWRCCFSCFTHWPLSPPK